MYLLTLVIRTNNNGCGNYMSSQSGEADEYYLKLVLTFLGDIWKNFE